MVPVRINVPSSFLVSRPLPPTTPAIVNAVPAAVLMVPFPTLRVTVRDVPKLLEVASVPPSKLRAPTDAPRLVSLDSCSVPPLIWVPPL
ncbi:hypothetical protein D3C81_2009100 [compost metagenome]